MHNKKEGFVEFQQSLLERIKIYLPLERDPPEVPGVACSP